MSCIVASIGFVLPAATLATAQSAERGFAPVTPLDYEGAIFMRKRTYGINIRVTAQEKTRIERRAKKCGLTVSEYLRQLAQGREPQELSRLNFGGDADGDYENMAHPR